MSFTDWLLFILFLLIQMGWLGLLVVAVALGFICWFIQLFIRRDDQ